MYGNESPTRRRDARAQVDHARHLVRRLVGRDVVGADPRRRHAERHHRPRRARSSCRPTQSPTRTCRQTASPRGTGRATPRSALRKVDFGLVGVVGGPRAVGEHEVLLLRRAGDVARQLGAEEVLGHLDRVAALVAQILLVGAVLVDETAVERVRNPATVSGHTQSRLMHVWLTIGPSSKVTSRPHS